MPVWMAHVKFHPTPAEGSGSERRQTGVSLGSMDVLLILMLAVCSKGMAIMFLISIR
jgi:hypothetical protein